MGFLSASCVRALLLEVLFSGFAARWAAPVALRKNVAQRISSRTASPTCFVVNSGIWRNSWISYHEVVEFEPLKFSFRHHGCCNQRTDGSAESIGTV